MLEIAHTIEHVFHSNYYLQDLNGNSCICIVGVRNDCSLQDRARPERRSMDLS
jgi:hypothetical protein